MIIKLLDGHRLEFLGLGGGGVLILFRACACRDVKLLEISCGGSFRNNETRSPKSQSELSHAYRINVQNEGDKACSVYYRHAVVITFVYYCTLCCLLM